MFNYASIKRKNLRVLPFLQAIKNRFGSKPILTDGGLHGTIKPIDGRIKHCICGTNLKNKIEKRFVQKIKDITECL
jgi:preprotein translocase subunit YajC